MESVLQYAQGRNSLRATFCINKGAKCQKEEL